MLAPMSPSSPRVLTASPPLAPTVGTARAAAGRPMSTPAAEPYVVATHKVRDRSTGVPHAWLPYGVQHAWVPGTRRTFCGQPMSGWTVVCDRRINPNHAASCHECVEAGLPAASRSRLDPRRA